MTHAQRYLAHVREVELPWLAIEGTGRSMLSQLRALPLAGRASAYSFVGASRIPVLAVFGAADETVPPTGGAALKALVPDARIEVLTGASHALVYDDAAVVARLVAAHVASNARDADSAASAAPRTPTNDAAAPATR
jgi:pimeloyl-ACP methyl ester carboxylesterase